MTTFKLSKRVQMILATLLVLAIGIIIAGAWTNDEAMASVTCTNCRTEVTSLESKDEEYHGYKCQDCSNWYSTEKHNYINGKCNICQHEYTSISVPTTCCGEGEFLIIVRKTASNHTWGCSACGQNGYTEEHKLDNTGVCLDCGEIPDDDGEQSEETEQCNHKYKQNFIDFVSTGGGWHDYYKFCTVCNMMIRQGAEECNEDGTDGDCSLCTESGKKGCAHTTTERFCYALEGNYHAFYDVCTNSECGYKEAKWDEACKDTDDDGVCDECKEKLGEDAKGTNSGVGNTDGENTECTHSYTMNKNSKQHWQECTKCGTKKEDTLENHTFKYKDNENGTHTATCSICSYKLTENHIYKNGKCEKCNVAEPEKECSHSYAINKNSNQHWQECTKCGTKKEDTLENHTCTYKDNENGTHTATCSICSYKLTESHTYKNGKCEKCNVAEPEKECSHSYAINKNSKQHWKECTKCGTKGTIENHTFKYKDNENGTHTATCAICSYKLTENHTYKNGKCEKCNVAEPEKECTHSYTMNKNSKQHWQECTKCGIKGTIENHTFKYKDNENGTHTATCSKCSYKLTENHKYENEKCNNCNAIKPSEDNNNNNDNSENNNDNNNVNNNNSGNNENNNNSNNNNSTTGDNTTAEDSYLKAGSENTILVVAVILGIVLLIISMLKMKKYKNI